jgi:hypothetical protein
MKNKKIYLIIALGVIIGFVMIWFKDYKPDYSTEQKALSFLYVNTNDHVCKIFYSGDSTIAICTGTNYAPAWNRATLYIELAIKNRSIQSFTAEKAGGDLGWFCKNEDDDPRKLYLNSFSKEDIELLKIAYNAFEK